MSETVENSGSASFDRCFKRGSNPVEIIQQIECDAIQAYENVVSQVMVLSQADRQGFP